MAEWWILELERGLRTVFGGSKTPLRPYPGEGLSEASLDEASQEHIAGLMRVNHAGEVCAQALYYGQALTHGDAQVAKALRIMGEEEGDHLAWYRKRLAELGDHTSYLDGFFYLASFLLGGLVGLAAAKHGLAFVEETERQVTEHLQRHLDDPKLQQDPISLRLVEVMQEDETKHADHAHALGAEQLPRAVRRLMKGLARVMIESTYRL